MNNDTILYLYSNHESTKFKNKCTATSLGMELRDSERNLKIIEVEVRYRSGGSPTGHRVRVKLSETLKKIKKHVLESLDINGRMTYRDISLDDYPAKRLSEVYKEGEKFCLITEKRPRDMKQHTVQLSLPASKGEGERTGEIKVARTTTIGNLKHKVQDKFGIAVDEHTIHMPSQQKECHPEHNVMGLSPVLQVKLIQTAPTKPAAVRRSLQSYKTNITRGTPYDTKQTATVSKRKSFESVIHPKILTRTKEKDKAGKTERV